jgi:hypothetical protein
MVVNRFVYEPSSSSSSAIQKKSKKDNKYCLTLTNHQLARNVRSSIPKVQLEKRMVTEAITATKTKYERPLTNDDCGTSDHCCITKAVTNDNHCFYIQYKNDPTLVPMNTTPSVNMSNNSNICLDTTADVNPTSEMNVKVFTSNSVPLVDSSLLECRSCVPQPASASTSRIERKKHRLEILRMKKNSVKIAIRNLLN